MGGEYSTDVNILWGGFPFLGEKNDQKITFPQIMLLLIQSQSLQMLPLAVSLFCNNVFAETTRDTRKNTRDTRKNTVDARKDTEVQSLQAPLWGCTGYCIMHTLHSTHNVLINTSCTLISPPVMQSMTTV